MQNESTTLQPFIPSKVGTRSNSQIISSPLPFNPSHSTNKLSCDNNKVLIQKLNKPELDGKNFLNTVYSRLVSWQGNNNEFAKNKDLYKLIEAYENRVQELESFYTEQWQQYKILKDKCQVILTENQELHRLLLDPCHILEVGRSKELSKQSKKKEDSYKGKLEEHNKNSTLHNKKNIVVQNQNEESSKSFEPSSELKSNQARGNNFGKYSIENEGQTNEKFKNCKEEIEQAIESDRSKNHMKNIEGDKKEDCNLLVPAMRSLILSDEDKDHTQKNEKSEKNDQKPSKISLDSVSKAGLSNSIECSSTKDKNLVIISQNLGNKVEVASTNKKIYDSIQSIVVSSDNAHYSSEILEQENWYLKQHILHCESSIIYLKEQTKEANEQLRKSHEAQNEWLEYLEYLYRVLTKYKSQVKHHESQIEFLNHEKRHLESTLSSLKSNINVRNNEVSKNKEEMRNSMCAVEARGYDSTSNLAKVGSNNKIKTQVENKRLKDFTLSDAQLYEDLKLSKNALNSENLNETSSSKLNSSSLYNKKLSKKNNHILSNYNNQRSKNGVFIKMAQKLLNEVLEKECEVTENVPKSNKKYEGYCNSFENRTCRIDKNLGEIFHDNSFTKSSSGVLEPVSECKKNKYEIIKPIQNSEKNSSFPNSNSSSELSYFSRNENEKIAQTKRKILSREKLRIIDGQKAKKTLGSIRSKKRIDNKQCSLRKDQGRDDCSNSETVGEEMFWIPNNRRAGNKNNNKILVKCKSLVDMSGEVIPINQKIFNQYDIKNQEIGNHKSIAFNKMSSLYKFKPCKNDFQSSTNSRKFKNFEKVEKKVSRETYSSASSLSGYYRSNKNAGNKVNSLFEKGKKRGSHESNLSKEKKSIMNYSPRSFRYRKDRLDANMKMNSFISHSNSEVSQIDAKNLEEINNLNYTRAKKGKVIPKNVKMQIYVANDSQVGSNFIEENLQDSIKKDFFENTNAQEGEGYRADFLRCNRSNNQSVSVQCSQEIFNSNCSSSKKSERIRRSTSRSMLSSRSQSFSPTLKMDSCKYVTSIYPNINSPVLISDIEKKQYLGNKDIYQIVGLKKKKEYKATNKICEKYDEDQYKNIKNDVATTYFKSETEAGTNRIPPISEKKSLEQESLLEIDTRNKSITVSTPCFQIFRGDEIATTKDALGNCGEYQSGSFVPCYSGKFSVGEKTEHCGKKHYLNYSQQDKENKEEMEIEQLMRSKYDRNFQAINSSRSFYKNCNLEWGNSSTNEYLKGSKTSSNGRLDTLSAPPEFVYPSNASSRSSDNLKGTDVNKQSNGSWQIYENVYSQQSLRSTSKRFTKSIQGADYKRIIPNSSYPSSLEISSNPSILNYQPELQLFQEDKVDQEKGSRLTQANFDNSRFMENGSDVSFGRLNTHLKDEFIIKFQSQSCYNSAPPYPLENKTNNKDKLGEAISSNSGISLSGYVSHLWYKD